MSSIPIGRRVFLDTNVLLYAVTEHPGYGKWANVLLDRIRNNTVEGVISVIVLNELLHQLVIGEVSQGGASSLSGDSPKSTRMC
jgi:predicted nucleic acid-binding protein